MHLSKGRCEGSSEYENEATSNRQARFQWYLGVDMLSSSSAQWVWTRLLSTQGGCFADIPQTWLAEGEQICSVLSPELSCKYMGMLTAPRSIGTAVYKDPMEPEHTEQR